MVLSERGKMKNASWAFTRTGISFELCKVTSVLIHQTGYHSDALRLYIINFMRPNDRYGRESRAWCISLGLYVSIAYMSRNMKLFSLGRSLDCYWWSLANRPLGGSRCNTWFLMRHRILCLELPINKTSNKGSWQSGYSAMFSMACSYQLAFEYAALIATSRLFTGMNNLHPV